MDENYLAIYWILTIKKNEVECDGGVIKINGKLA